MTLDRASDNMDFLSLTQRAQCHYKDKKMTEKDIYQSSKVREQFMIYQRRWP